jgi:uncharacterized protein YdaU (DUF1376 family)
VANEALIQHKRLLEEIRIQRQKRAKKKRGPFGLWGGRKTGRARRSAAHRSRRSHH